MVLVFRQYPNGSSAGRSAAAAVCVNRAAPAAVAIEWLSIWRRVGWIDMVLDQVLRTARSAAEWSAKIKVPHRIPASGRADRASRVRPRAAAALRRTARPGRTAVARRAAAG